MKTIFQLAKVARRIPRVRRKAVQILVRNRRGGEPLTDSQVQFFRAQIAGADAAKKLLEVELHRRNVGGKPVRDSRPLKVQKAEAARSLAQNPPALALA